MSVLKRSVSVDAELWDELVREPGAGPVSPLVNAALAHDLHRQRGLAAVAAYEAGMERSPRRSSQRPQVNDDRGAGARHPVVVLHRLPRAGGPPFVSRD
jgi:hypothetical protein